MNKPFAKIFVHPEHGQMLVVLEGNDEGAPSIAFATSLAEWGLGVCRVTINFPASDDGWDKAESAFSAIDHAEATEACAALWKMASDAALESQ